VLFCDRFDLVAKTCLSEKGGRLLVVGCSYIITVPGSKLKTKTNSNNLLLQARKKRFQNGRRV
jgi:hypothetical protein